MLYIYITVAIVIAIALFFLFIRRERFSDYNAPNDFMKLYYTLIAQDPAFEKKFPFYGTGDKSGLRCRKPNNQGCSTIWIGGELVELTPALKKQIECKVGMIFDN
jgi:hypothetical protein